MGKGISGQHDCTFSQVRGKRDHDVNRRWYRAGRGSGHATVIYDQEMVVPPVRLLDMRVVVLVVRFEGKRDTGGQHDGDRCRDGGCDPASFGQVRHSMIVSICRTAVNLS